MAVLTLLLLVRLSEGRSLVQVPGKFEIGMSQRNAHMILHSSHAPGIMGRVPISINPTFYICLLFPDKVLRIVLIWKPQVASNRLSKANFDAIKRKICSSNFLYGP